MQQLFFNQFKFMLFWVSIYTSIEFLFFVTILIFFTSFHIEWAPFVAMAAVGITFFPVMVFSIWKAMKHKYNGFVVRLYTDNKKIEPEFKQIAVISLYILLVTAFYSAFYGLCSAITKKGLYGATDKFILWLDLLTFVLTLVTLVIVNTKALNRQYNDFHIVFREREKKKIRGMYGFFKGTT